VPANYAQRIDEIQQPRQMLPIASLTLFSLSASSA
jgi:hypothetical protein